MTAPADNAQLEGLFSRLDVHLKGSQHKKALRLVEESAIAFFNRYGSDKLYSCPC